MRLGTDRSREGQRHIAPIYPDSLSGFVPVQSGEAEGKHFQVARLDTGEPTPE